METEKLRNHRVLGDEFKERLERALGQQVRYDAVRAVMDGLECNLSTEQLGRVAEELAAFYNSGEAKWALETPMPSREAARLLSKVLDVGVTDTYAYNTGYFAHLSQAWQPPKFAAGTKVLAQHPCGEQTHYHLEYEGHHIGLSVSASGRYWEVIAMLYGHGESAKLTASYWAKENRPAVSYMPLRFFGA